VPSPSPASPPRERVAAELLELVGRLRRGLRRATAAPWPGRTLTGAQMELARLLRRRPGLSVNQAAEALALAPNTVSSLVGQLTDAGLVRRVRDERDGRVARLELTGDAQRGLEAWRDERAAALLDTLDRLGAEDRRALDAALAPLGRLVALLEESDDA
jgi:DNA-binding MarR family transcriptional regulator